MKEALKIARRLIQDLERVDGELRTMQRRAENDPAIQKKAIMASKSIKSAIKQLEGCLNTSIKQQRKE